jgi:serine/threonine protein kinase
MELDAGQLIVRNFGKVQAVYKIGKVLGFGSFGEIREVEHRESQEMYVIKMMTKRLMTASVLKRVQYEINIQKKMNHPNIAKITEWFENKQRFYIVQELLAGGELLTKMNKQRHKGFTE